MNGPQFAHQWEATSLWKLSTYIFHVALPSSLKQILTIVDTHITLIYIIIGSVYHSAHTNVWDIFIFFAHNMIMSIQISFAIVLGVYLSTVNYSNECYLI